VSTIPPVASLAYDAVAGAAVGVAVNFAAASRQTTPTSYADAVMRVDPPNTGVQSTANKGTTKGIAITAGEGVYRYQQC
jgi:hypothetical protein